VPITSLLANHGRVVFIDVAPLIEALRDPVQDRLILSGPPGLSNIVQCTRSLAPPVSWAEVWTGPISNLFQVITVPITDASRFYRITRPLASPP
jgi:hypothetical protein